MHYNDVIMSAMASPITNLTIVYSTVYWGTNQRKIQSSVLLAFVRGIHRWPVNSPRKVTVTRKMCPFDDVIMALLFHSLLIPPITMGPVSVGMLLLLLLSLLLLLLLELRSGSENKRISLFVKLLLTTWENTSAHGLVIPSKTPLWWYYPVVAMGLLPDT